MNTWQKTLPTEEGYYWFYGYIWGPPRSFEKTRLEQVQIRRVSNGLIYFIETSVIEEREVLGFWQPMVVPDVTGLDAQLPKPKKDGMPSL